MAIPTDRMRWIQRASRALLIFFIFVSIISLWSTLSGAIQQRPTDTLTLAGVVFRDVSISTRIHGLWLFQTLMGAALMLKVLFHLIRLMILFSTGRLFTLQSVTQIRHVGFTFALSIAAWLVVLIGIGPEVAAAQDQWLQIMPSFPGGALIGACFFLFAGRIIDEARELREEQDLVV